jgi:hypothetical protein
MILHAKGAIFCFRYLEKCRTVVPNCFFTVPQFMTETFSKYAFQQAGLQVDVVAHAGSEPLKALKEHPNVHLHLAVRPLLLFSACFSIPLRGAHFTF